MPHFRISRVLLGAAALAILMLAGCGVSSGTIPVSGTVKFSDGTVPQGEVSVVRFEPVTPGPTVKAAAGPIKPDGSFTLTTLEPNDGAYPGDYNVTLSVFKTYAGREQLIAEKFTKAETTPLKATVKSGATYTFTIEKAP